MSRLIERTIAVAILAGFAASAPVASAQQFTTDSYFVGPRLWIGNLNGAMAIGGQIEKGLTEPGSVGPGIIAAGVGVDYYSWSFGYSFGSYKYSVIPIQVFGNYHFVLEGNREWDPYVGLAMVYSAVSASWSGSGAAAAANASSLGFAGQGGIRYFFSEKFAVNAQVGFGYGSLGLGATWKF